ncbi:uncharacterized protein [Temnothorax longispinosus]|uniref:uncharacterized protein isoform X1 n=2 Tax=Temnothorax longispinosus TaxID=300112 RepID=UPI003A9A6159
MYTIEYNSFRIKNQIVKRFLEELEHICDELEDKNEIAIIKKYGNEAKRFAGIIILFYCSNVAAVTSIVILPVIPGAVVINKSQMHHLIQNLMPVYYVNQEEYCYLLLLHMYAVMVIGGTAMVAAGIMLLGYLKHACGMFRIASYRIEKALMTNMVKKVSLKNEIIMYKEMILAVDIHRKAIKFSEVLFDNFQGSHFFLITVGVICLSLNLYGITKTLGDDIEQFIIHFLIVGIIWIYFFLVNYTGQEITDHYNHVFSTAYNVRWYIAPLHVQKLILFLLQRGSKTINLQLGGIFILSLEFFATLTKASISYFTVVYSTQQ